MNEEKTVPKEVESMEEGKIIHLDVRPILQAGGEPFGLIMDAIGRIPAGGALNLLATFKPVPLFHVLGNRGWSHWVERGEGEEWSVWFYRADSGVAKPAPGEISAAHLHREYPVLRERLKAEGEVWHLDVRGLSPPEPMELTLTALEKLPAGTRLVQINERVPQFLLPILLERGFRYTLEQKEGSQDGANIYLDICRAE